MASSMKPALQLENISFHGGQKYFKGVNVRGKNMGVSSGGQRGLPWIFIHGTNIVDRGLKVLFSVFFSLPPPT